MPDPDLERIIADLQRRRAELERSMRDQEERERATADQRENEQTRQ